MNAEVPEVLIERQQGNRRSNERTGVKFRSSRGISVMPARQYFQRSGALIESRESRQVTTQLRRSPAFDRASCLYVGSRSRPPTRAFPEPTSGCIRRHDHDANAETRKLRSNAPFHSVYISFPSAKDPDFERRHPGRCNVEVVTSAPYDWFTRWEEAAGNTAGRNTKIQKRIGSSAPARTGAPCAERRREDRLCGTVDPAQHAPFHESSSAVRHTD